MRAKTLACIFSFVYFEISFVFFTIFDPVCVGSERSQILKKKILCLFKQQSTNSQSSAIITKKIQFSHTPIIQSTYKLEHVTTLFRSKLIDSLCGIQVLYIKSTGLKYFLNYTTSEHGVPILTIFNVVQSLG